jgi:F-type H+-transporting ATPase subunit delta
MKLTRRTKRAATALFRLCLADGVLDRARARVVAARLAHSPRRGALPVLAGFYRLVRLDAERQAATVESAIPLDAPTRLRIESRLTRIYGPTVQASYSENPALIAGVRVKVGSDVYDDSVRARLAALNARL